MTTKKNVMFDCETMGTRPNAPVLSVGGCFFDPMTGEIGDKFYARVDLVDAMSFGSADPETMRWWLRQSDEARAEITKKGGKLADVLNELAAFYNKGHDAAMWSNGPSFDAVILEYAFHRCLSQKAPWPFWNVRDVRTVVQLAEGLVKKPAAFTKGGVAHNALDDCIFQVGYVSKMWQALRGKSPAASAKPAPVEDDILDI